MGSCELGRPGSLTDGGQPGPCPVRGTDVSTGAPKLMILHRARHHRRSRRFLPALVVAVAAILGAVVGPWGSSLAPPSGAQGPARSALRVPSSTSTTLDPDRGLPPLVTPTGRAPLRVLEIGDSLGIDLGLQLQAQLDSTGIVDTTVRAEGDSGLCNTAFFDWPTHLAVDLATYHPEFVVVFIGANDDQGTYVDGTPTAPDTPAWKRAYAGRVDSILREAERAGARVVWVGMPPMEDQDLAAAMQIENAIFGREVTTYPGTVYVSSTTTLGTSQGGFRSTGTDGQGNIVTTRTSDGVHLTPAGAGLIAHAVIGALENRWQLSLGTT